MAPHSHHHEQPVVNGAEDSEDDIESIVSGTPSPDREVMTVERLHKLHFPPIHPSGPWRRAFNFQRNEAVFYQLDDFAPGLPVVTRCLRLKDLPNIGVQPEMYLREIKEGPLHPLWIPYFLDEGWFVRGWKDINTLADFLEYGDMPKVREQEEAWESLMEAEDGSWIERPDPPPGPPNPALEIPVAEGPPNAAGPVHMDAPSVDGDQDGASSSAEVGTIQVPTPRTARPPSLASLLGPKKIPAHMSVRGRRARSDTTAVLNLVALTEEIAARTRETTARPLNPQVPSTLCLADAIVGTDNPEVVPDQSMENVEAPVAVSAPMSADDSAVAQMKQPAVSVMEPIDAPVSLDENAVREAEQHAASTAEEQIGASVSAHSSMVVDEEEPAVVLSRNSVENFVCSRCGKKLAGARYLKRHNNYGKCSQLAKKAAAAGMSAPVNGAETPTPEAAPVEKARSEEEMALVRDHRELERSIYSGASVGELSDAAMDSQLGLALAPGGVSGLLDYLDSAPVRPLKRKESSQEIEPVGARADSLNTVHTNNKLAKRKKVNSAASKKRQSEARIESSVSGSSVAWPEPLALTVEDETALVRDISPELQAPTPRPSSASLAGGGSGLDGAVIKSANSRKPRRRRRVSKKNRFTKRVIRGAAQVIALLPSTTDGLLKKGPGRGKYKRTPKATPKQNGAGPRKGRLSGVGVEPFTVEPLNVKDGPKKKKYKPRKRVRAPTGIRDVIEAAEVEKQKNPRKKRGKIVAEEPSAGTAGVGESSFPCPECEEVFSADHIRQEHVNNHHGSTMAALLAERDPGKALLCRICNKFIASPRLKKHAADCIMKKTSGKQRAMFKKEWVKLNLLKK